MSPKATSTESVPLSTEAHNHLRQTLVTPAHRSVADRSRIDYHRSAEPKDSCPIIIPVENDQENKDERKGEVKCHSCEEEKCQNTRRELEEARFKLQQIESLAGRSFGSSGENLRSKIYDLLEANGAS